jgi:ABC-type transporter lipoprotein component MlaA
MLMLPTALVLAVTPVGAQPAADLPSAMGAASGMPDSASPTFVDEASAAAQSPQSGSDVAPRTGVTPLQEAPHPAAPVTQSDTAAPAEVPPAADVRPNDIVITGRREPAGDPLREVNAEAFAVTQKVDDTIVGPAARTYKKAVPSPIRKGIHNFLYNLREPIVFLNFMLQLKPGKAAETVGRFAINTTVGAAGLMDIAKRKPFHLPRRSNGFANTLGYYGVKNGPFLFLPLVGPTTVRDLLGGAVDRLVLPVSVGSPFTSVSYTAPAGVLGALDHRSEFDQTLKDLHDNSPDPYAATRAFYLNRRQAEIDQLRGRVEGDPEGMSGPPPSVRPFVPADLEPKETPIPQADTSDPRD